jgi:hypothetical protein
MNAVRICPKCLRIEWYRRPDGRLRCTWCKYMEPA